MLSVRSFFFSASVVQFLINGQRLEQELGIYHYGARWYDRC